MIFSALIYASIVFLIVYLTISFLFKKKPPAPLPPGPTSLPLVGNITELPQSGEKEWEHWLAYKSRYGPISSITVLGQTIVILNDAQMAFDLFEKRSAKHSSRPRMVFAGEMVGWENAMSSQFYNAQFREYRKQAHQVFGTQNLVSQFSELQDTEVKRFLLRTLEKPDELVQNIRTEAGAIILKIAYGYTIEPHQRDPLVDVADEALMQFAKAVAPGAWMVDVIPSLRFLPDWFPGTNFKRTAAEWRATLTDMVDKPYEFVKQRMKRGDAETSYLSKLLEKNDGNLSPEESFVAKWTSASLYGGGADTTVSTLSCFFLSMTLYPEVQRKAQEEIDRVVGTGRLPNFEDRENLPYVDAVVKEALRWHPVTPIGLPHVATEDDIYNGYFIPKGAMSLAVIWGFMHDPNLYSDPMRFKPERFLGEQPDPDPHTMCFGFGRRVCPGRVLADMSVYLTIAQSLAVFKISTPAGIHNKAEFEAGIISHPIPYKADIRPRSEEHEKLIRRVEVEHPWQESDAKYLEAVKA